jgi:hypothetical protein
MKRETDRLWDPPSLLPMFLLFFRFHGYPAYDVPFVTIVRRTRQTVLLSGHFLYCSLSILPFDAISSDLVAQSFDKPYKSHRPHNTHSLHTLPCERFIASSKTSDPESPIYRSLFQLPVSSLFLNVSSSSCLRLLPRFLFPSILHSMTCFRRQFLRKDGAKPVNFNFNYTVSLPSYYCM